MVVHTRTITWRSRLGRIASCATPRAGHHPPPPPPN
jgi:hypothetical protein